MSKLFGGSLHTALVHAVTQFDMRQEAKAAKSPRGYHNPYALAQYMKRVDDICRDVAAGASVRAAIFAGVHGALLPVLLRAACEPKATAEERFDNAHGGYTYRPVAAPVED